MSSRSASLDLAAQKHWPIGLPCPSTASTIAPPGGPVSYLRGFDLVVLEGDRIALNEVYVHPLEALPAQ